MARLLRVYEDERLRAMRLEADDAAQIDSVINTLVNGAMEDLTSAADLLDHWGRIASHRSRLIPVNVSLSPQVLA